MSDEPTPRGITTSEGITAIVTAAAPIVAALAKLDGWQLVASLGIAAAVAVAYLFARTWLKRGGVAALLVLLLTAPARADDPPPLAPINRPVLVTPDPAPPPLVVTPEQQAIPAADLTGKLAVARNQLDLLAAQLGVPVPAKVPSEFWGTTAGKVVTGVLTGLGVAITLTQTAVTIYVQVR